MRVLFLLLLFCGAAQLQGQTVAPWPGRAFAEVRAFAWPDDHTTEAVIRLGGRLKPGVLNPEGALLSAEQVKRLQIAVVGQHKGSPSALCYYPHNAFVFYDAAKRPVAFVEVCFTCGGFRAAPRGAAQIIDEAALAALFGELKLPMGKYKDLADYQKSHPPAPAASGKAP
jgi:hypothetical protein